MVSGVWPARFAPRIGSFLRAVGITVPLCYATIGLALSLIEIVTQIHAENGNGIKEERDRRRDSVVGPTILRLPLAPLVRRAKRNRAIPFSSRSGQLLPSDLHRDPIEADEKFVSAAEKSD